MRQVPAPSGRLAARTHRAYRIAGTIPSPAGIAVPACGLARL